MGGAPGTLWEVQTKAPPRQKMAGWATRPLLDYLWWLKTSKLFSALVVLVWDSTRVM